jgi:hypothetical protein
MSVFNGDLPSLRPVFISFLSWAYGSFILSLKRFNLMVVLD